MRPPRLLARASLALCLLLASAGAASAAEPSPADIAQARDLAMQANNAFEANNLAEAEKLWVAAQNLYPAAPTITLGLARTQAKLGKVVAAQESYQKIIREHGNATNLTPAFKDALESAKTEIGPVSAKVASVVITVEGAPNPTVTIDGQPVSTAALGLKRPVDPGAHVVHAEAPGFKPAETTFQVAEAGQADAKLQLEKAEDATAAPAPSTGPAPEQKKSSNKTMALVAFGVGGAGLVLGAVTGVLALGKHGDLEDQCSGGKCPSTLSDDVDGYNTMGALSTVGFVVAGLGAAAGVVLLVTAPKESPAATAARRPAGFTFQPYVGLGGGGVAGRF
jgi:hypothetical protein